MSEQFIVNKIHEMPYREGKAFDIGANIGDYSRILASKFSKVYAFEPHPDNVQRIKDNTFFNIIIEEMAISNFTGTCKLYTQPNALHTGHSISEKTLPQPNWQLNKERFLEVPCITIDDFCHQHNIIPLFIKMDIEGGEDTAWEGAIKTLRENNVTIALEIHNGVDVGKLEKLFIDLGYKFDYDIPEWYTRHAWISKI